MTNPRKRSGIHWIPLLQDYSRKGEQQHPPRVLPRAETPPPQEVPVVDVVPLSPPAAPPSALALAMARLTDLTAQMEFQYAKHLQLSREHEIVKTKLTVL